MNEKLEAILKTLKDGSERNNIVRLAAAILIITTILGIFNFNNIQKVFFPKTYYKSAIENLNPIDKFSFSQDSLIFPFEMAVDMRINKLFQRRNKDGFILTKKGFEDDLRFSKGASLNSLYERSFNEHFQLLTKAKMHLTGKNKGLFKEAINECIRQINKFEKILTVKMLCAQSALTDVDQSTTILIDKIEARSFGLSSEEKKLLLDYNRKAIEEKIAILNTRFEFSKKATKQLKDLSES